MALSGSKLKAEMQQRIYAGLQRVFSSAVAQGAGYPPIASEAWMELADAISDSALAIVQDIQSDAEVLPGIPIGGPFSSTTGPGKIE